MSSPNMVQFGTRNTQDSFGSLEHLKNKPSQINESL